MNRLSFIKSLVTLIAAPKLATEIDYKPAKNADFDGSKLSRFIMDEAGVWQEVEFNPKFIYKKATLNFKVPKETYLVCKRSKGETVMAISCYDKNGNKIK